MYIHIHTQTHTHTHEQTHTVVIGQHIPKGEEGLGVKCVLRVPTLTETCPAAFLGRVEMATPHMVGREGVPMVLGHPDQ